MPASPAEISPSTGDGITMGKLPKPAPVVAAVVAVTAKAGSFPKFNGAAAADEFDAVFDATGAARVEPPPRFRGAGGGGWVLVRKRNRSIRQVV